MIDSTAPGARRREIPTKASRRRQGGSAELETDGLVVQDAGAGCRLRLRVRPGARANSIVGIHAGALKLGVTAPPERGLANEAVVSLLAEALGLPRTTVEVVGGRASRDKTVRIAGLTRAELLARLEAL